MKEYDNVPALVGEIWYELIRSNGPKRIYLHYAKGPYLLDRVVSNANDYLGSFTTLDAPELPSGGIDLDAFKDQITVRVNHLLRQYHEGARIPSILGKYAHQWYENPAVD